MIWGHARKAQACQTCAHMPMDAIQHFPNDAYIQIASFIIETDAGLSAFLNETQSIGTMVMYVA